jgi:hypothetical protein
MSDRKLAKAAQALFRQIRKLARSLTKALVTWLLRSAFVINRRQRRRTATAGFVLPTTVMLILVVGLTVGAMSYRAFNSSNQIIGETKTRIIYNAATPAIDRARAKLEFLFDANKDNRLPSGVPSESILMSMMLNDGSKVKGSGVNKFGDGSVDPYELPDEDRIDINGDGKLDNAWTFRADTDGKDGPDATIAYSITFSTPPDLGSGNTKAAGWQRLVANDAKWRATGEDDAGRRISYVRNAPLSNATGTSCAGQGGGTPTTTVEQGWYQDTVNTSILRKAFQVDAFVVPDSAKTGQTNFTTMEFQQDRILNRGNKWGAWFRNDLEVFPGPQFNWNGAMHTEGSLIMGGRSFNAYLISSPNSCLFYESASEVTVTETTDPETKDPFRGLIAVGTIRDNDTGGSAQVHVQNGNGYRVQSINSGNDWMASGTPYDASLEPNWLQTTNGYRAKNNPNGNTGAFDNARANEATFGKRFISRPEKAPYVDDTFRADNLYGPKQRYDGSIAIPAGKKAGQEIQAADFPAGSDNFTKLTSEAPGAGADASAVGLDGYWERRARNQGLRLLVGQRLELGNSNGWVTPQDRPNAVQDLAATTIAAGDGNVTTLRKADYATTSNPVEASADYSDVEGDPLNPPVIPTGSSLLHEQIQRRALRDNIAAVQSTAIYHASVAGNVTKDYPIACYASTAHPGTPLTLRQSINFVPTSFIDSAEPAAGGSGPTGRQQTVIMSNFFLGRGTNGWEFTPPGGTESNFQNSLRPNEPLRNALDNLAYFAGDHTPTGATGAFPPTQEAGKVHPDPGLTMWGNFSNLRRALANLDTKGYANLSPADRTYLQTAACTVGMLAYNIDRSQRFNPRNPNNDDGNLTQLGGYLYRLMDGRLTNGEVLPKERLATYEYDRSKGDGDYQDSLYNPRDYDHVPAEAFLAKLREQIIKEGGDANDPKIRLAELVFSHFQIRRDRTYGFRTSPAANTWNYNPYVVRMYGKMALWSSACDPNIFALTIDTRTGVAGATANNPETSTSIGLPRLGLSRLCGTVIPAGAIRQFPGDLSYPARADKLTASNVQYLPKSGGVFDETSPTGANPLDGVPTDTDPRDLEAGSGSPAQRRFRTDQNAFRRSGSAINNATFNQEIYKRATVAPKWPSLYYLFPQIEHDHFGSLTSEGTTCIDHRQPNGALRHTDLTACSLTSTDIPAAFQPWAEPYITDSEVQAVNNSVRYKPVSDISINDNNLDPNYGPAGYTVTQTFTDAQKTPPASLTMTYKTFGYETADRAVNQVMVLPRALPSSFTNPLPLTNEIINGATAGTWRLPVIPRPSNPPVQNTPPNLIYAPVGTNPTGVVAAVPFLDRVLFNGREWMPSRVLDIDLGMLRRNTPSNQNTSTFDGWSGNDPWLPVSGIVYAFREDAIREDAIARPAAGTATDARTANPTDPALTGSGISTKSVDFVPDPARRAHGFRLRNGSQLKRHADRGIPANENVRGLSFFTDDLVYIMGYYNLHQKGGEDSNDPRSSADETNRLEEFTQKLPIDRLYNETEFYDNRTTRDSDFTNANTNRWRPSEILADSITILSENFCDGSALDTFMTAGNGTSANIGQDTYSGDDARLQVNGAINDRLRPYRDRTGGSGTNSGAGVYNETPLGLFGPGCSRGGVTSFLNQNRPSQDLLDNHDWVRENPADLFSPVRISRNGNGATTPPRLNPDNLFPVADPESKSGVNAQPTVTVDYNRGYYDVATDRPLQTAQPTRVNSIIISGLVPSRVNQSYGGMHNFPRFLENWRGTNFWFNGSFLQLNFSNYTTAPYDQDAWEPGATTQGAERISYYQPPNRLWGYDVALQQFPAGPAASRFVTPTKERNEFYTEPPANDPYINNLCRAVAAKGVLAANQCPS